MRFLILLCATVMLAAGGAAKAAVITATTTHSVIGEVYPDTGIFTFGSGGADAGGTGPYDVTRGFAEFDLSGMSGPVADAQLSFRTGAVHSCCVGNGILIDSYKGNGLADTGDFQAAGTGSVGSFTDASATLGSLFSFDITALVNAAIAAGDLYFGIRLGGDSPWTYNSFFTFTDFEITTGGLVRASSVIQVSEPTALLLLGLGLIIVGLFSRRAMARGRARRAREGKLP